MVELPASAAWRHRDARDGFEVVFLRREPDGYRFAGHASAVEERVAWAVRYAISVDLSWATRSAHVVAESELGAREAQLETDGVGAWRVDGRPAPELAGCADVALVDSGFRTACPSPRRGLLVGPRADAPAAYVRAPGLAVERLEQSYARLPDEGRHARYDYASPAFDFRAALVYDPSGLLLDYPGLAVRVT